MRLVVFPFLFWAVLAFAPNSDIRTVSTCATDVAGTTPNVSLATLLAQKGIIRTPYETGKGLLITSHLRDLDTWPCYHATHPIRSVMRTTSIRVFAPDPNHPKTNTIQPISPHLFTSQFDYMGHLGIWNHLLPHMVAGEVQRSTLELIVKGLTPKGGKPQVGSALLYISLCDSLESRPELGIPRQIATHLAEPILTPLIPMHVLKRIVTEHGSPEAADPTLLAMLAYRFEMLKQQVEGQLSPAQFLLKNYFTLPPFDFSITPMDLENGPDGLAWTLQEPLANPGFNQIMIQMAPGPQQRYESGTPYLWVNIESLVDIANEPFTGNLFDEYFGDKVIAVLRLQNRRIGAAIALPQPLQKKLLAHLNGFLQAYHASGRKP